MNRRKKMEKQATVKKELWESPRTEFEMFVPDMYCKSCEGGHWVTEMNPAGFDHNTKFCIDSNNNKLLDPNEANDWKNTDGTYGGLKFDENEIRWGWVKDNATGAPNIALFPNQKGSNDHYYAYYKEDVWFETNKS